MDEVVYRGLITFDVNLEVKGVQLAIDEAAEDSDHLISPEDAVRIAMARQ